MGIRVLATVIVTAIGMVGSFYNAFYGLIAYAFWSYVRPETVTWGTLPFEKLSYFLGLILVVTTILQKKKLFVKDVKNFLAIVFLAICYISLFVPTDPTFKMGTWQFQFFSRVIIISLLITVLIDEEKKFYYYCWAIVIFIGLVAAQMGIIGSLKGFVGGARYGLGGPFNERNEFAGFLCMTIPVVIFISNIEKNKWLKLLLYLILLGDILALILTYSRGGFIGLVVVGAALFFMSKRKIALAVIGGFAILFIYNYFLPQQYKDRLSTIQNYDITEEEVDMSAAGRLMAWRMAIEMVKDHPILGVGFHHSQQKIVEYKDPLTGLSFSGPKGIHNSLLLVAAEEGIPGIIIFVLIFFLAFRSLMHSKRIALIHGLDSKFQSYATMLEVAFLGYFSSGFFLNLAYVDIPWHFVGLTIALEHIINKEIAIKKESLIQETNEKRLA